MKQLICILFLLTLASPFSFCQKNSLIDEDIFREKVFSDCVSDQFKNELITIWRKNFLKSGAKSIKKTFAHYQYGEKINDKEFNFEKYADEGKLIGKRKVIVSDKGTSMETLITNVCKYYYDSKGRINKIHFMDSSYHPMFERYLYEYNDKGEILTTKSEKGDNLNQMIAIGESSNTYDGNGRLAETNTTKFNSNYSSYGKSQLKNSYDDKGRLIKAITFSDNSINNIQTFDYSENGSLLRINSLEKKTEKMKPVDAFTYDQAGKLIKQENYFSCGVQFSVWSETVLESFENEFDTKGLPVSTKNKNDKWEYKYDSDGRLVEVDISALNKIKTIISFTYK